MGFPLDEPIVQTQAVGRALLLANRYCNEWAKSQGLIDAMAVGFAREPAMLGSIGMGRHENVGDVGERELAVLRLIAPHFQRVVSISKQLDLQAVHAQNFATALDAVAAGVLLVDGGMHVLHANGTAAAMLRSENAILTRRGVLLVAAVAQDEAALGRRGIRRAGPRAVGRPGRRPRAAAVARGDPVRLDAAGGGRGVRGARARAPAAACGAVISITLPGCGYLCAGLGWPDLGV